MPANSEKDAHGLVRFLLSEQPDEDARELHIFVADVMPKIAARVDAWRKRSNEITLRTLLDLLNDKPGYLTAINFLLSNEFQLDVILEAAQDPQLIALNEQPPAPGEATASEAEEVTTN